MDVDTINRICGNIARQILLSIGERKRGYLATVLILNILHEVVGCALDIGTTSILI